jgi:hypothetical protein
MDSAADFDAPDAFSSLLAVCMRIKRKHRLKGRREGDWEDFPELGRTQYQGSQQSDAMLRLYEKGRQQEYLHLAKPDWVRAEIQVRPAKEAKEQFATVSALDAWGAANWSRELAGEILAQHVDPHPAGTVWKRSNLDRQLHWLCVQYGPTLLDLHSQVGSWECVGLTLNEKIKEVQAKKH